MAFPRRKWLPFFSLWQVSGKAVIVCSIKEVASSFSGHKSFFDWFLPGKWKPTLSTNHTICAVLAEIAGSCKIPGANFPSLLKINKIHLCYKLCLVGPASCQEKIETFFHQIHQSRICGQTKVTLQKKKKERKYRAPSCHFRKIYSCSWLVHTDLYNTKSK